MGPKELLLLLSAAIALALVARSAALRLTNPYPLNPWESAIVVDAWRTADGTNVYRLPEAGPATHMYGPLVT
jgi:hypothetical protein